MGAGASAAGAASAVKAASDTELKDALCALSAKDQARLAVAIAWRDLNDALEKDKSLIAELGEMATAPPKVVLVEEALCKVLSIEAICNDEKPDWHLTATIRMYRLEDEVILEEMAAAKQKRFLDRLSEVHKNAEASDVAAKLKNFVKNPEGMPEAVGKVSSLMESVSVWLHAFCGEGGQAARDEAWTRLTSKLAENKTLVDEISEMTTPPPKVALVEEALCKACSIDGIPDEKPDWHLTATIHMYRLEDETLIDKAGEAQNKRFISQLGEVKTDSQAKSIAESLASFVANPDLGPQEMGKSSMLFQLVSAWLHALHKYCAA